MAAPAPIGQITRGTTGTNRLRRVDRWIARHPVLRRAGNAPLVVDLGYGANAVTTLEMAARLSAARSDVEVLGLEIDPARVVTARAQLARVRAGTTSFDPAMSVRFDRGGFEVPAPRAPRIIRAMNVLRQYDEDDVAAAWASMTAKLDPGGMLVEGTCSELGRVATWIELGDDGAPRALTISLRLDELDSPSIAAERLPKALIHRNRPGERIHDFLAELDAAWVRAAALAPFGPTQRWIAALEALVAAGWPLTSPRRWRLGEVTVPWERVSPG